MDTNTQQLIIKTLGIIAIIGEIGTILIIALIKNIDIAIITALITFISGITGGLIGFLGAKTITEEQNNQEPTTHHITDQEILQIIDELETPQEVTPNVQHTQKEHNTRKQ